MAERRTTPSNDLVNQISEWGLTVSEASPRKGARHRMMQAGGHVLFAIAAILILPVAAAAFLFTDAGLVFRLLAIMVFCAAAGMAFKLQAGKGPRNAVQIDYRASEVRLGTRKPGGPFIRQRVMPFRQIEAVRIDRIDPDAPELVLEFGGETLSIAFNGASEESLGELAAKISAARESARHAPISTRIQNRVHGIGAGVREVKSRIRSRIAHA